ncbi:MAG: DUF2809 domain-containing protein [Ruminiclostridium sp.]|nr:DUF2809 domain-containing protein [Ruminiclostridium sp.]
MKTKLRIIYSILFCLLLLTEICIALFVNDSFIRPYVGDMLVTVLICCFLRVFIPTGIRALPLYVFIFSAIVEVAQYFDIVKLLGLDGNGFLSVLLGRTFSFFDLLCYAVGCLAFLGLSCVIERIAKK